MPALLLKELQSTTAGYTNHKILNNIFKHLSHVWEVNHMHSSTRNLEVTIQSLSREEKILFRACGSSSTMSAYAEKQNREREIDQKNSAQRYVCCKVRWQEQDTYLLVGTMSWVLPRRMKGEKVLVVQLTHYCFLWIFSWPSEVAKPRPLPDSAGSAIDPNIGYWL